MFRWRSKGTSLKAQQPHITENVYVILYFSYLVIVTYLLLVDLNELKLFLGNKIRRNGTEIYLDQSIY